MIQLPEQLQPYATYIFAGLGLIAAIILFWLFSKLFRRRARGRKGERLGIVEYTEIDQTRRLVLLRRDDVEHLVMIGGEQDLLIEANIGAHPVQDRHQRMQSEPPILRVPKAPVFGARRPPLHTNEAPNDNSNEPA